MLSETDYKAATQNFSGPGLCKDLTLQCREIVAEGDPFGYGNNDTVNEACAGALGACAYLTSIPETYARVSAVPLITLGQLVNRL